MSSTSFPAEKSQDATGSMRVFDRAPPPGPHATTFAGLVLLYAPSFAVLPPVFLFRKERLSLGRDDTSDFVVEDNAVSRRHALFRHHEGRWLVTDAGSRNGVILDGERVFEAELHPGSELRIGDATFKFVEIGAEQYGRHRIDGLVEGATPAEAASRSERLIVGGMAIDALVAKIERLATGTSSVVIQGESGTGKELFAKHFHHATGRKGQLVAVNCAAIPDALLESELFGVRRGAFSGAHKDRPGLFRAAHEGTLFLDEVGELSLSAQAKLLRAVEAKEIVALGATRPEKIDVRIVCATHRNLRSMVDQGKFRGDLYARLHGQSITLLPLRDRKEDIFLLCRRLLERAGQGSYRLSTPFMSGLLHYDFPFNVRELQAFLKAAVGESTSTVLGQADWPTAVKEAMKTFGAPAGAEGVPSVERSSSDLIFTEPTSESPVDAAGEPPGGSPSSEVDSALRKDIPEVAELVDALVQHRGNLAAVCRQFGRSRPTVYRWLDRHGLRLEDFRVPE